MSVKKCPYLLGVITLLWFAAFSQAYNEPMGFGESAEPQVTGPPLPAELDDYILDQAGIFSPSEKQNLSITLQKFEEETSNQLVVAIIPEVPSDQVLEEFTQRTAEKWGVGRRGSDNGIVLFVFPNSRQVRIEVGYGLEGAIPDVLANQIIQDEMIPLFRSSDLQEGIQRGVQALMAASKDEYTTSVRKKRVDLDISALVVLGIVSLGFIWWVIFIRKSEENPPVAGRIKKHE